MKETIQGKARKFLEEIKQSINRNEQTFNMTQLNSLKTVASELERHTCKHIIRYIFQESPEIERYPEAFRERFDIAFSQAVIRARKKNPPEIFITLIIVIVFISYFSLVNMSYILGVCSPVVC